jgi:type VI secretion system protein ImpM
VEVGLYGKLFSHGDFLRRRVSDAFVDGWDAWLQQCMATSRAALADRWLDLYLTSPVWRFACAAGVCGPAPIVGLMAPSVDRVGRYFPLTIVAEFPLNVGIVVAATRGAAFFVGAERLIVEALAQDDVDFNSFDALVARLEDTLALVDAPQQVNLDYTSAALLGDSNGAGWQVPLGSVDEFASVWTQLLSHRLSSLYDPLSMWWTDGSAEVQPSCLVTRGLPHPETYKGFLDGTLSPDRWRTVPAIVETPAVTEETLRVNIDLITCRSAAMTDVGSVRRVNQDAFLERPEIGLWVVADGLGGHTDGDVASRMVCDALADFAPEPSFDETVEAVRARIRQVNEHLLRRSARSLGGAKVGSTVVVLLIRGTECALLWAGDSRIYRLRANSLVQLTRDHSAFPSVGGKGDSNVITRAVGVSPLLLLDLYRDQVRPGDRFLLCSDGLTRRVSDEKIEALMQHEDLQVCVEGLIQATLDAGAPDNVTALVAEAVGGVAE